MVRMKRDLEALNGRFIEAMEALGHTGYTMSKELGTSEAVISNIRNQKNPPNIMLVREMLNKFLELDPDWLLFGRGVMMRSAQRAKPAVLVAPAREEALKSVDRRLDRLEQLIRKSLENQLERSVMEDESMADLEERLASIEKRLAPARKVPGKRQ